MGTAAGDNRAYEQVLGRQVGRRLIARPRLTALLDEAPGNVLALVGPAGFGKTTLAREWMSLASRDSVWYRGSEASSDVAELLSGLAQTIDRKIAGVAARTTQRVRAVQRPQDHAHRLADAFVNDLREWPSRLWLVIDDYQCLMRSRAAEDIITTLSESGVNLLVTSRERPSWATPRRLLYGEVYELNRSALALTAQEAFEVVGPHARTDLPGLMALTEGWPAVIGLAALAREVPAGPNEPLPESLYEYFADELFRAADPRTQKGLCTLCLLARFRAQDLEALLGRNADYVIRRGEQLGFLTRDREHELDLHPLLRAFLRQKLALSADHGNRARDAVVSFLLEHGRWDDAFELIVDYELVSHFDVLSERGLYPLLDAGRVATVERWIDAGISLHCRSATLDLMQAEVLFRQGNWRESERMARSAAAKFSDRPSLKAKAFYRAGHSAQLSDNHDRALAYHKAARDHATSPEEASEALWGMFITQCELEQLDAAKRTLSEFNQISTGRPEDELRGLSSAIVLARRLGALDEAVASPRVVKYAISRPADPIAKSGFLQALSTGLNLVARYNEALEVALVEIEEARALGLEFVLPHGYCNAAVAHLGLRNIKNCVAFIAAARSAANENADMHAQLNANAIQARLLLSQGKAREAVAAVSLSAWNHQPTLAMSGDYLATRALALACVGDMKNATRQAQEARRLSRDAEATVLATLATAIMCITAGDGPNGDATQEAIRKVLEDMQSTGNRDSVVCAYRAYPPLLSALMQIEEYQATLRTLISSVGDNALAKKCGIETNDVQRGCLTPRESEVLELIRSGLKNDEIARALWIAESTVKVHVRHIKHKLNARTRTDLAVRAVSG
jgi:LuxR family transcriptional regulator, maltose regulon positive regulatory protein